MQTAISQQVIANLYEVRTFATELTVIKSTWLQLLAYLLTCVTYEERFDLYLAHTMLC